MTKKIKFGIICNEKTIRNIEELRDNFNVCDIYDLYKNGKLQEWLGRRSYNEELAGVGNITTIDAYEIVIKLCEIFGVAVDANDRKIIHRFFDGTCGDSSLDRLSKLIKDNDELRISYKNIISENAKLKNEVEDKNKAISNLNSGIYASNTKLAEISQRCENLERNYKLVSNEKNEANENLRDKKQEIDILRKRLAKEKNDYQVTNNKKDTEIASLKSSLENKQRCIEELEWEVSALKSQNRILQNEIEKGKESFNKLNCEIYASNTKLAEISQRCENLERNYKLVSNEKNEANENLRDKKQEIDILRKRLAKEKNDYQVTNNKKDTEIASLKSSLENKQKCIEKLEWEVSALKSQNRILQNEIEKGKESFNKLYYEDKIKELENNVSHLESQVGILEHLNNEKSEEINRLSWENVVLRKKVDDNNGIINTDRCKAIVGEKVKPIKETISSVGDTIDKEVKSAKKKVENTKKKAGIIMKTAKTLISGKC